MPRLRLLADSARSQASGAAGQDNFGNLVFDCGAGEVVPVVLDATGWAGADSVASSAWVSDDGAALSSRTLAGKVASCNAYVPGDQVYSGRAWRVTNTLTLNTGAVRKTTVWLRSQARERID